MINYKSKFNYITSALLIFALAGCGHSESPYHHDESEEHHHEDSEAHYHEEPEEHFKKSEEHNHEGSVVIEPEKAAEFGIIAETITPGEFTEVIKTSGRIEPASNDLVSVSAAKSGIFTLSPDVAQGVKVSQGSRIGAISKSGIEGGDTNAAAHSNLQASKKELDRLSILYKEGLVTASEFNEAERAYKENLALASSVPSAGSSAVVSPCNGTLSQLLVTSGQYVEAGTPIAVVVRNSKLTLRADVPARHTTFLPKVTDARFRPEYSDSTFSITALNGNKISNGNFDLSTSGLVPLYFSFDSNGLILPGAYAEVYLTGLKRENVLTLPLSSLLEMQGNNYVYEVHDGHAYEKKLVKTGASDGYRIEILEGIDPGETIVVKGATVVRMAETAAIAPPSHNHEH